MARRRRNYSRRGAQKKSTKPDPQTTARSEESKVNDKEENKPKEFSDLARIPTASTSSVSTFGVNQVPPRKRRAAFISVDDSNEIRAPEKRSAVSECANDTGKGTHLQSKTNSNPLRLKDFYGPGNPGEKKGKGNAPLPIPLSVVKLEKCDDSDVCLNEKGEERCDANGTTIKVEEIDFSVNTFADAEDHTKSLWDAALLPTSSLISELEKSFNAALPCDWFCKATNDGFNVMLLSCCKEKAIQRRIFFSFQGEVEVSVHRKLLPPCVVDEFLKGLLLPSPVLLAASNCKDFEHRALGVVHKISTLATCRGADQCKYQNLWFNEKSGVLDSNPYGESTYVTAFRSVNCKRLTTNTGSTCEDCVKLLMLLRRQFSCLLTQMNGSTVEMVPYMLPSGCSPQHLVTKSESVLKSPPAAAQINGGTVERVLPPVSSAQHLVPKSESISKPSSAASEPPVQKKPNSMAHYAIRGEISGGYEEKVDTETCLDLSKPSLVVQPKNTQRFSIPQLPAFKVENSSVEFQSKTMENKYSLSSVAMPMVASNSMEKAAPKTYLGKEMTVPAELAIKQNQMYAESSRYGKIKLLLEKSAVLLENGLSKDLLNILKDSKDLSAVQQQLIEMQTQLASEKRAFGMKWLPTLIRYALFMKSLSGESTGSGMITLPSGKVLFNFSQVLFKIKKEFQKVEIAEILKKPDLKSCILSETYNILLIDEIDVSDNLVYQKSNGELIGFVKLSDVKDEMDRIEDFIVADKCFSNRPIPSYTMLVYMVKGMSNNLKEVVALLDAEDVSPQKVYDVTWNIIGTLEQHHIKVISVVTNGFPRTKSFLDLQTGVKLESGQIYATKNTKANDRPLFFLTDASYLLKRIRNCVEESGSNGINQKILTKNKETITWKTIEKLYLMRKCPNLKGANVFLNEYSRKKVSHASAVLSSAVALDLKSRYWSNTCETVLFISKVSDTFGTLLSTDIVEGNELSEPFSTYSSMHDVRFPRMLGFLDYLSDWKTEVDEIPVISAEDKSKLLLDEDICKELEMSLRAFVEVSSFLLKEGVKEIDPNDFWLAPIGKYLEKGWFGFVQTSNSFIKRPVNFCSFPQQAGD